MAIINEVREKLNKGQNIFRREIILLLVADYNAIEFGIEEMRRQYNNEFLKEKADLEQKIQSLETDLIQTRRVADERQVEIQELAQAFHNIIGNLRNSEKILEICDIALRKIS